MKKTAVLMLSWLRFDILLKTLKQLPKTCSEPLHLILRVQGKERLSKKDYERVQEAASDFASTDIYFTLYNVGTAAARLDLVHRAVKSGYKYLLLTDDDIKFSNLGIDRLVQILDNNPKVGAAALRPDNKRFLRCVNGNFINSIDRHELPDLFYKVFFVGSAALMFRSNLYTKHLIAPDPAYYIGCWDYDLCLQIIQAGYEIAETPNYTIRNKRGGDEDYKKVRYRKEHLLHNREISINKWGFCAARLNSAVLRKGKVKIPNLKRCK